MSTAPGTRVQSRSRQIGAIKRVAARLLAEKGVAGLSLREVAREMGLVSSALYRYFATRDELLTALIFDAYNQLGANVERAEARVDRSDLRGRWVATCAATRRWAKAHPNEYALLYGTPVPGYHAPDLTIAAATRVAAVMGAILNDDRRSRPPLESPLPAPSVSFLEVERLKAVMPDVAPEQYIRALMAWSQVFGFINFELFGHFVGSVRDDQRMFATVVEELADFLDLAPSTAPVLNPRRGTG